MSRLGPFITLAAGGVLAAGLGVASVVAAPASNTSGYTVASTTTSPSPAKPAPTKAQVKTIPKADYAGYVKGNGGLIAVSVRNGKAVAYFCDGRAEAWFKGREADGKVTLTGFGGAKATATLGGGKAKGWLALSGKRWTFTAPTTVKPSGLYRATAFVRGAKLRAGWIVLAKPRGGFYQVGAAFEGDRQIKLANVDDERPTDPVKLDQTTVYPKDVDSFIEEMS
ncbi:MAG: hypothetical protein HOY71_06025 [Nonomuraea sp.]|nr:hypothetical protein [Nonomuraea sp.]